MEANRIGNYIHYKYNNFIEYGIGTRGRPNKQNLQKVFEDQRKALRREAKSLAVNRSEGTKIENILNGFRDKQRLKSYGLTDAEITEFENYIHNKILEKLDIEANAVNWDTFDVVNGEFKGTINGLRLLKQEGKYNNIRAVNTRIDTLYQITKEISDDLQMNNGITGAEFKKRVNALLDEQHKLKQEFQSSVRGALGTYNKNAIKEINDLLKAGRAQINSYLKGEIAELYAAAMVNFIKILETQSIDSALDEFIKIDLFKGVVGKETGAAGLLSSKFAVQGLKKESNNSKHFVANGEVFTNFNGINAELNYTQNKIDVTFTLPLEGDKQYDLSIKNYKSGHNITIHSGVSILTLTQDYSNFMNHYLNLSASHPYEPKSLDVDLLMAQNVLKQTMALKGLVGGIWKVQSGGGVAKNPRANLFVVNDNNGLYKVYYINDIVNRILSDSELIHITGLDKLKRWENEWVGSEEPSYENAYARINNLLSQLHTKFKYKVQLDRKALL